MPTQKPEMETGRIPVDSFFIHNRKYLGSKQRLLSFLRETMLACVPNPGIFIDGFAGTGVVACALLPYVDRVIANDYLYSNFLVLSAYLATRREDISFTKLQEMCRRLDRLPGEDGYVFEHFGGTYFTRENASRIDAVREQIEKWRVSGDCSPGEERILLTGLLFAIDKIANTVGQYDAFLKNLGRESYSSSGRHLVDCRVYQPLRVNLPSFVCNEKNSVYCHDINALLPGLQGDVLYLDPPYNNRQYIDCYHLLENIMRWQKPPVFGKTRKFSRDHLKSAYSRRREAPAAFGRLIASARVSHIFLSYNNEGIIPDETIFEILESRGPVRVFEHAYTVFGNGAGVSSRRPVTERLFYCRVMR